jgi:hypothetical protein
MGFLFMSQAVVYMKPKKTYLIKRLSLLTAILSLALVFGFADQVLAAHFVDENFEGTGYEESWTELLVAGGTLDEDANIPGTPPSGAGDDCLKATVPSAGAYALAKRVKSNQDISYVRAYMRVNYEGFNNGPITQKKAQV